MISTMIYLVSNRIRSRRLLIKNSQKVIFKSRSKCELPFNRKVYKIDVFNLHFKTILMSKIASSRIDFKRQA